MSPWTLRMRGWLLVIAAAISIASTALAFVLPGPVGPDGPPSNAVSVVNFIAGILFLVSISAAYTAQKKQVGVLGLFGIIALWLTAFLYYIVLSSVDFIAVSSNQASSLSGSPPPYLFALVAVGTVVEVSGGILFGIRTIQARVFPNLIGWILIAAAVLAAIDFPLEGNIAMMVNVLSNVLLFLGIGWLGYAVVKQTTEVMVQPTNAANKVGL